MPKADVLLSGVRPLNEQACDVWISDGRIRQVGAAGSLVGDPHTVRPNVAGQILLPGLVDLHTHLREPGREDAETIATGCAAAAMIP